MGERGVKLSGGQKQKLALARLILRNVDVLNSAEATSALDQESGNSVFDSIYGLGGDKTCIVVSHWKSSIDRCERQILP